MKLSTELRILRGWSALMMGVMLVVGVNAGEVKLRQVEPDLGDALGFGIYRFEAELGEDEWLVVEERSGYPEANEGVFLYVSRTPSYRVTLVDSGMLHPSLSGTVMLRYPNHQMHLSDVRLAQTEVGPALLRVTFAEPLGNAVKQQRVWSAFVISREEFAKKWPTVETPTIRDGSSSRLVVKLQGDRP